MPGDSPRCGAQGPSTLCFHTELWADMRDDKLAPPGGCKAPRSSLANDLHTVVEHAAWSLDIIWSKAPQATSTLTHRRAQRLSPVGDNVTPPCQIHGGFLPLSPPCSMARQTISPLLTWSHHGHVPGEDLRLYRAGLQDAEHHGAPAGLPNLLHKMGSLLTQEYVTNLRKATDLSRQLTKDTAQARGKTIG